MMIRGTGIFGGIVIGQLVYYRKNCVLIERKEIQDVEDEICRLNEAVEKVDERLSQLFELAEKKVGRESAVIFRAHKTILHDNRFKMAEDIIRSEHVNAEFAVKQVNDGIQEVLGSMEDELIRSRGADFQDVADRLIHELTGGNEECISSGEPIILFADDLTPSEFIKLDKTYINAIVMRKGSETSHTSILARIMNIPMVIEADIPDDNTGTMAIVDAGEGIVITDPDDGEIESYKQKAKSERAERRLLMRLKGADNITKDGKHIFVDANISSIDDVESVLKNDADGIGLFRSEFLSTDPDEFPDEEAQFEIYRDILKKMNNKRVVIRTLSKRALNEAPEKFAVQLRAIYRASIYGRAAILIPMIVSLGEVRMIKWEINMVKEDLESRGIPFSDDVELGIMIETPAAAIMSDVLGKEVDFFSVGTNDLTQYMLAVDRDDPAIRDSHNPAILRMLKMIVKNGHECGCRVGICGELGSDLSMTGTLLKLGFDELSVNPSMILRIRHQVIETDTSKIRI
ncbi:MAG: phosphoenolpyruvate--protein phosphotransferase [Lachnospiraceae bacterium]|jgi:phosphotransferase system enzyme I (PtsI)